MNWTHLNITIAGLQKHYHDDDFTPRELIQYLIARSEKFNDKNIWISPPKLSDLGTILDRLARTDAKTLPLYGVPFAVKDNIDVAGFSTTAACKEFAYAPSESAFVVKKLVAAGAIPLGKTNMDQFATGLVGTRSPWGACKNAYHDEYISGGSSSGSAVAVALELASFSLGTDTAGSGRVPAAFNKLVGLKPSKGLLSNTGVVPACKSLDVVSIFSHTAADANKVFDIAAAYDPQDAYARPNPYRNSARTQGHVAGKITLGVPSASALEFFDDDNARQAFEQCVTQWKQIGADIIDIDFAPFLDAARLLYEGPWVTERYIATKELLSKSPNAMHTVVREIIEGGKNLSAEAAFNAQYTLSALKKLADKEFAKVDFLLTPTTATQYTIDELIKDPIRLNSQLGYYTNYMNLLDYAAIALPYTDYNTPIPSGFTLVAPAFNDQKLMAWATTWHNHHHPDTVSKTHDFIEPETIDVVVCGAHLEGEALNWQLVERGAYLVEKTTSAPHYQLFALADGKRPAMVRNVTQGVAIDVERWSIPSENFGSFVAAIPAPLGIGKVELNDGKWYPGFICDMFGLDDAKDISALGGWRQYLRKQVGQ